MSPAVADYSVRIENRNNAVESSGFTVIEPPRSQLNVS